jgi:hypothetical protein
LVVEVVAVATACLQVVGASAAAAQAAKAKCSQYKKYEAWVKTPKPFLFA